MADKWGKAVVLLDYKCKYVSQLLSSNGTDTVACLCLIIMKYIIIHKNLSTVYMYEIYVWLKHFLRQMKLSSLNVKQPSSIFSGSLFT